MYLTNIQKVTAQLTKNYKIIIKLLQLKSQPKEIISERVKLMYWKRKTQKTGRWVKILAPNELLLRLPEWLAQIKTVNNSCKPKYAIRQIVIFLYLHK